MGQINPIARLYSDITSILKSLTIKYSYKAEEYETFAIKSKADRYLNALMCKDVYEMYDDYTVADFNACGEYHPDLIEEYQNNRFSVPKLLRSKLLLVRREREVKDYVEENNYYRMLSGFPDIGDEEFMYVPKEYCDEYGIPYDLPIHLVEDKMGKYYINVLENLGFTRELEYAHPDKPYLRYLGSRRITVQQARTAKNFAILRVQQDNIMESTYREFIRCYERARMYFVSTCYVLQYRTLIPNYDQFIALCIFIMAIQQVSVRSIQNATDREFYDSYLVQLLYETYGVPYFTRADQNTQKQIVQNINVMIQNKATNKVILDIASLLGFTDVSVFQYYLTKTRRFDDKGRPVVKKKKQVNTSTGEIEEVYDMEAMYSIHFQKVDIKEENVKEALTDSLNRVEYSQLTYYDPFWWEDDTLHSEIWDTAYNYMETKYMGITTPYRLTAILFQSIILMRMILEKKPDLYNVTLQLPKITNKEVSLVDTVILFFALMAKKFKVSGQIMTLPSKLIHILEVNDQEINKDTDPIEVLGFNFKAFTHANLEKTISELKSKLVRRKYRVVRGHDVDLREDGTQDKTAPTHKIQWTIEEKDLDELYKYLSVLTIPNSSPEDKIKALNKVYENIECLYWFLSYRMSATDDMEEYYALKKFYDTAFYSRESAEMFEIIDEDGKTRTAETFLEYLKYHAIELYDFVVKVDVDITYTYIDHIIYKMEQMINNIGYLYILNDGFSPLMELFQILVLFYKSYRIDFVDMTSLMVIDWDLENTIRFFGKSEYLKKTDKIEDRFGNDFMDLVRRYVCHYRLEDKINLYEYIRTHCMIHLEDECLMTDMMEYVRSIKADCVNDEMEFNDTVKGVKNTLYIDEALSFSDACVKKK